MYFVYFVVIQRIGNLWTKGHGVPAFAHLSEFPPSRTYLGSRLRGNDGVGRSCVGRYKNDFRCGWE